jgi:hypothetical protein
VTAATLDQARGLANGDCQLYDVVAALEARRQKIEWCYGGAIVPWRLFRQWANARGLVRMIEAGTVPLYAILWGE